MIVAFTGGRNYHRPDLVTFVLGLLVAVHHDVVFRVGDCPTGLDKLVRESDWFRGSKTSEVLKADWKKYGQLAGPTRNMMMLVGESDAADLLIAFPGGAGTANCVTQALQLGIPVCKVP